MKQRRLFVIYIVSFCLFNDIGIHNVMAQRSKAGEPPSFKEQLLNKDEVPLIEMPSFDIDRVKEESKENGSNKVLIFAHTFEVDINVKSQGLFEKATQGKVWRLRIKSKGAYSTNLILKEYKLPQGAELYLYNPDMSQMLGAFTSENNNKGNSLALDLIKGDEFLLNYLNR